jgi:hypothetical protein
MSHSSTSWRWKMWWQGKTRTLSPLTNSERQIAHSSCDSNHGWFLRSLLWKEEEASSIVDTFGPSFYTIGALARTPCSRSISTELADTGELCSALSCFSQPLPVQMCQGRLWTISSGALSRWAARAARIRWIKRVTKVRIEGSRRIMTKVIIGLRNENNQTSQKIDQWQMYEYQSQAEYSAVISNDNVRNPEWVVFEFEIRVLRRR